MIDFWIGGGSVSVGKRPRSLSVLGGLFWPPGVAAGACGSCSVGGWGDVPGFVIAGGFGFARAVGSVEASASA